jgi:heme exporter protein D
MAVHLLCAMALVAAGRPGGHFLWFAYGIILLFLAPLVILAIVMARKEKKRAADLKQTAESLGFEFVAKDNTEYLNGLKDLPMFARLGRRQKILNLMRGKSRSFEVTIFDHQYVVSAGEHSQTHRQSIVCFESESLSLPDFTIGPKGFWNKIGALLGKQSIEFSTHPAFAEKYVVRGSDADAIRDVLTETVIEHFEQNPGWSAEGAGDRLLLYKANKRVPPAEIEVFLEDGLEFLSVISAG